MAGITDYFVGLQCEGPNAGRRALSIDASKDCHTGDVYVESIASIISENRIRHINLREGGVGPDYITCFLRLLDNATGNKITGGTVMVEVETDGTTEPVIDSHYGYIVSYTVRPRIYSMKPEVIGMYMEPWRNLTAWKFYHSPRTEEAIAKFVDKHCIPAESVYIVPDGPSTKGFKKAILFTMQHGFTYSHPLQYYV